MPHAAPFAANLFGGTLSWLADAAASSVSGVDSRMGTGHSPIRFENLGLSPIALDLGFFTLKWYSLAYLVGIIFAFWHLARELRLPGAPMAQRHAEDLFFYATLGVIFGGRLGYAIFYAPDLLTHPQNLVKLWQGGMSFHGGLIGTTAAIAWVSWRGRLDFIRVCDYISPCVPVGLFLGRCANFVNGELWGRAADASLPWAIVFPNGGPVARHPSQLYEAGLEGIVLGTVLITLFWTTRARWRQGLLTGTFMMGYGMARFIVEYFREPDVQLEDFAHATGLSMGQWLTLPMIAIGLALIVRALRRPPLAVTVQSLPA
jgi:phosphatidylglycerol:prolipoprotein diacylglycerol transferase